jgi:hypothetical protein
MGSPKLDVGGELHSVDMGRTKIKKRLFWNLVCIAFDKYYNLYYLSLIDKEFFFDYLLITSNKWKDKYAYLWIANKSLTQQHLECNMTTSAIITLWNSFTKCKKTYYLSSKSKCIDGLHGNFGTKNLQTWITLSSHQVDHLFACLHPYNKYIHT